jgi:hypothetical protein
MTTQSEGSGQADVGLGGGAASDGCSVADGVRVGSPGLGEGITMVGNGELVIIWGSWDVANLRSAIEISRLPPMIAPQTRAARTPEINSRRLFIEGQPLWSGLARYHSKWGSIG